MKIIKQQEIDNWSYRYTCDSCDSELEVECEDIKYKYNYSSRYSYSGGSEENCDFYSATCPVCKRKFEIPSDKLPKLVKLKIKDRVNSKSITDYFNK